MDCNFTTIKTCELKYSAFRSRILDFGDFDISDYTFSAVYKAGFDQIISEQEITPVGNILTVPLEAIEGASNRAKVEVWMLRDGGFKDKVIVFDVVISATGCPSDSTITDGVSVTFGGLTVPVEVNQGIVNISREVAFSTLSPEEKIELKGEPFVYEDFTPEQLTNLKGPQGDPLTFSDLTTEQVNELKQPAVDAAIIATTAAQNADTAAGLATTATGQAIAATSSANGAASAANIAATNADQKATLANTAATEANAAAANTAMRYNDAADTLVPDVIRRVDDGTKIEQEYKQTITNIDGVAMTEAMVDGFMYIKRGNKYYVNSDFAINRTVYVDSYHPGGYHPSNNPVYQTIAQRYPNVTLAQVQELDPDATLDDSSDWYILMWLNRNLPVNSTLVLTNHYALTRKITWRRSNITWKGGTYKASGKYPNDKRPSIYQLTAGEDCIAIVNGDGLTNNYSTQILGCTWQGFNIVGTKTATVLSGDGISINIPDGDMVYCHFKDVRISNHGKNGFKHYNGHVNEVYFDELNVYANFDCGMWWSGRPNAQTNLLDFQKCSFGTNGYVVRGGAIEKYDWKIDGFGTDDIFRLTKGGLSFGNLSATTINSTATQENGGFGIMLRNDASVAGVNINCYGEGDPLGSLVVLCHIGIDLVINSSAIHTIAIYPEIPDAWIYSSFKSLDHYRRFIAQAGINYNKSLTKIPWTNNLITDSKHRKAGVGETVTRNVTYSIDSMGSVVTTVEKIGLETVVWLTWLTYEERLTIPENLSEGDLVTFSLDIKFDYIHDDDKATFAGSQFGVRRYIMGSLSFLSNEDAPTFDGEWKRIHVTYEHKGLYDENILPQPFIYMGGTHPVTFSIRNPELRVKTRNQTYSEVVTKASQTLKGIVNQAEAVADVATADATDLATALTLVNELKAKLNAKLGVDRTAGQQAT